MNEETSCELFYGRGGHGGPYRSVVEALAAAVRLLHGGNETVIEIKPRTAACWADVRPLRTVRKDARGRVSWN